KQDIGACTLRSLLEYSASRGGLGRGHDGTPGFHDASLRTGDGGDIVPENLCMVDIDGSEDRDARIGDVGCVPLPSHSDLDHGDFDWRIGEDGVRQHGEGFEEGDWPVSCPLELRVNYFEWNLQLIPCVLEN